MADLTTLANVRAFIGKEVTNTSEDAMLSRLITVASAYFRRETGREFDQTTYTETFDGDGTRVLPLTHTPVISVTSVFVDGVEVPAQPAVNEPGWALVNNCIELYGYIFTRGSLYAFTKAVANVTVIYSAGYNPIPADVEQAVIELTVALYREKERFGIATRSNLNETSTYLSFPTATAFAQGVIEAYRRISL